MEGRVGVELEWLAIYEEDPTAYVPIKTLEQILTPDRPLPGGSRVSFEPGGQVEISSLPGQSAAATCIATAADLSTVRSCLAGHGIRLVGVGVDPYRTGCRFLRKPRYDAMEAYFGTTWPEGRVMMRSSCSVHVNLDVSSMEEGAERWRLVHALGPTLSAAFANSAILDGSPSGWRSTRLALWQALDPSRTLPTPPVGDPVDVWTRYALEAAVMFITTDEGCQPLFEPMTFAEWLANGHPLGYPDLEDLKVHLTTLFPPIRPKGWLELRMIDALPDPWWRVPVALTAAIVYDPRAVANVEKVVEPTADLWTVAARYGMAHPLLREAACVCFESAIEAMDRVEVDDETARLVVEYHRRYIAQGRSPADDQLQAWGKGGSLLGFDSTLEEMWT
ncbi:MAG: ergothioneine biosynthesis glutamate--cysteine ligase EgtA [Actinomycetota bacterium]